MKTFFLSALLLSAASVSASACPSFNAASSYTEVAVACNGATPDLSQPASVNQPDGQGGECRLPTSSTEYFLVNGTVLYWYKGAQVMPVGILLGKPSCYQTDTGGDFYSTWTSVSLSPAL